MPRTSRRTATTGLAWQALAPVVRWPLHSPRRLASLVAVLFVIGWLVATLGPSGVADPAPGSVTSSTRPPAPSAPASPSSSAASTASGGAMSAPAVWVASSPGEVAVQFVTVWARPDLPAEVWRTDVTALATPEFGAQLATVLPTNVPARRVVGSAVATSVTELVAAVTVPTDAGPVLVDLAAINGAWRVCGVTPAGPPRTRTDGAGFSLAATYTPLPAGG